jgi:hypothetical protein
LGLRLANDIISLNPEGQAFFMIKKFLLQIPHLQNRPIIYAILIGFGIAGIHFAISYLLWKPLFDNSSCSPNILDIVLISPGLILLMGLGFLPPPSYRFISSISLDFKMLVPFIVMIISSCFYGIGGTLLLFSEKKIVQLLGVILIVLFILAGFYITSLIGPYCAGEI